MRINALLSSALLALALLVAGQGSVCADRVSPITFEQTVDHADSKAVLHFSPPERLLIGRVTLDDLAEEMVLPARSLYELPQARAPLIRLAASAYDDLLLLNGSAPSWVLRGAGTPAGIDLNFAAGLYYQSGAPGCTTAAACITTSRASTGYAADLAGNYYSSASNVPRITNQGLLVEENRTNGIRNNSMQGAVAGTPGTMPTNWGTSPLGTLTQTIVGIGTTQGIDYIDLQFSGTTGVGFLNIFLESAGIISASYGQTWTGSSFTALVGGSLSGISSIVNGYREQPSGTEHDGSDLSGALTSSLQRLQPISFTNTQSGTSSVFSLLKINFTSSAAIVNFTLRIGWPGLELNAINSSVASATVNSGGSLYVGATGTMTWSGAGCSTNPVLNVTDTAGVITAVNSVATAGSCTTFPSSSATTWTPGGGLSTGSGASFNLVPTNNAASGFATSPIRTTSAAVTRATDVVTLTTVPPGSAGYSFAATAIPEAPNSTAANQIIYAVSDTTVNNTGFYLRSTGALGSGQIFGGSNKGGISASGTWAQNTKAVAAGSATSGAQALVLNGGTVGTASGTPIYTTPTRVNIGSSFAGASQFDGYISRIAIWPTALPNATLKALAP